MIFLQCIVQERFESCKDLLSVCKEHSWMRQLVTVTAVLILAMDRLLVASALSVGKKIQVLWQLSHTSLVCRFLISPQQTVCEIPIKLMGIYQIPSYNLKLCKHSNNKLNECKGLYWQLLWTFLKSSPEISHKAIFLFSLKFPYYYSSATGYVSHSSEFLKHSVYFGKRITDSPVLLSCKPLT